MSNVRRVYVEKKEAYAVKKQKNCGKKSKELS